MGVNNCNMGRKIGFLGSGKMASAIMGGIVRSSFLPAKNIYAYDVSEVARTAANKNYGVNVTDSLDEMLKSVDTIVIATKPFVINEVLSSIKGKIENKLIVSILAGVTTSKIEFELENARVIRVMPNTPAFVNEGMCALCGGKYANDLDLSFIESMLKNIGQTVRVDENDIDIVTAISGSGPAFYYKIIDLIARAGEKLGLDYKTCLLLSAQTALGSAKMILEDKNTPDELITAVTTPGGCTAVGNDVLNNSDLERILDKTIKDTMDKARALG